MSTFVEAVRERVRAARQRLAAAHEAEDPYEAALAADELDDALRLARKHGIDAADEAAEG
ncbi:hypothetical protein ABT154_00370 [Streptomyces sp. NPDC001728]|uniref:hypothetical protein n=1 Tax=Streptomyces sp. NPDC001728 TaxID=3154396 RepID=UPI00332E7AB5